MSDNTVLFDNSIVW